MIIDTHCHIYLPDFDEDRENVLIEAKEKGVTAVLMPNIDSGSIIPLKQTEKAYPGYCHAMMGLHPCSVKENYREEMALIRKEFKERSYVAIGEIGMDLYWDKTFLKEQEEVFLEQISLANEYELPVVIHSRDSLDLIISLLKNDLLPEKRGIFHCYPGNVQQAEMIIDLGFVIGVGGVVTYKKSMIQEVVFRLGLKHIVLETDAPYLSPVPFRGKRNQPGYLFHLLNKIAELTEKNTEEVSRITTANAKKIFKNII